MFRHRANPQKPADGLYVAFRESFPEVHTLTYTKSDLPRTPSHSISDPDLTPRTSRESWKFTPPLPDSNSCSPATFSIQPPEGTSTSYYNEDVDLATPEIGVERGIRTPQLLPTLGDGGHIGWRADTHCCLPQTAQPYELCHLNLLDSPQDLAPCYLSDHPTDFESPDDSTGTHSIGDANIESEINFDPLVINTSCQTHDTNMLVPLRASTEKFRFHTTLNTSTAMVQQAGEVPATYLNKGQVYSVCIVDTAPIMPGLALVQYRTSIRISLGDMQRLRPMTRWNLWKERRRTDEVYRRDGELRGVEYVETGDVVEYDSRTSVELKTASLDGFSVLWTRKSDSLADCHIAVRFNFLSTDFSYSKGVKGILCRLCAKTEIVSTNSLCYSSGAPEICVCNIKVFRSQGAERKRSNDITYIKKSIDKLKQQIVQAEAGIKHSKKRKRDGTNTMEIKWSGPVKDLKHTRTPPRSSASPVEDLYTKLQAMQDMFISTQPVSVFCIRGQELDDPDLHPLMPTDDLQQFNSQHLRSPPDRPAEVQMPQQGSLDKPTR
ncbi:hypothetical protein OIDMADRAFT_208648 [Oidiodendron maius Zn]|uniref:Grh/CP2 DB domain-containing protein n=1 Tax=Oidiodendron maius (strain Zn) TaxID=913774 RepID=A0A0C3CSV0_OIDMZ|nr:hypothetical protein OIDMADRAFT_208648 [Oidiodendron maius Zn]